MTKDIFLMELRKRLHGLSKDAIDSRIEFYSEMIDDSMEEGLSEEEAIAKIGSVDDVINKILEETPLLSIVKEKAKPKRKLRAWEIILLVLGFPLWFPLGLTAIILLLVAYLLIWVMVLVVYSVFLSLAAGSIGGIVLAITSVAQGNVFYAGLSIGAAICCAGLAILLYYASVYVTKATLKLTKKMGLSIKLFIVGKGEKNE